jgi:hypothetical protein
VIDLDLDTGTVRGQSWIHVYSSRTAALDLSVQMTAWRDTDSLHGDLGPAPRAAEVRTGQVLSWSALPGRGLGGLEGRAAPQLFDGVSRLQMAGIRDPLARPAIDNVPFAAASTKSFADYWTRTMPTEGGEGLSATTQLTLAGSVHNPLPIKLADCVLLFEDLYYRLPEPLLPGQTIHIDDRWTPKNLNWELTQKRTFEGQDLVTAWDPRGKDAARILELMMFHKAAGGDAYTGLTSVASPGLDLSDHLQLGRAVLLGRAEQRALDIELTPAKKQTPFDWKYDQSHTFYRLVLPVQAPAR